MTKQTAQQCSFLCSHTTCTEAAAAAEDGDSNQRAHSKQRRLNGIFFLVLLFTCTATSIFSSWGLNTTLLRAALALISTVGRSQQLEGWRGGGVERWRAGDLERWRAGEVERWRSGEVEGWRVYSVYSVYCVYNAGVSNLPFMDKKIHVSVVLLSLKQPECRENPQSLR
ncbi:hypothetical protein EYF80_035127 [Liparis tanakae]|uniref:Uncharacterized protein n=1 Tax=Liparis tanakae TaxID=230148 RepID=A0A4Z2GMA7_9TELE|nr:hypothetical protein EYF80_035127 [Liparis tanakae]